MQVKDIKEYLRIEHDEDDAMLNQFIIRAKIYIKNGVGKINEENELFKMAILVLVGHWYDNRELARIGNASYSIPHSFEAIIQQLRYCYKEDDAE
ncbi:MULTISPECIES: head-tail connector protein [unclassified Oceanobacillus]|uniref:head-tail connector protein n=1 Tax=unclassified Oceanobacillus TaxID=2630292 RepID=UPI001BEC94A1|nr:MULTISPECIES: head-tail connector protein [unclassified Oceanobacillus]MBT2600948.1 phage gp6-like head-tail connector protein [Oceanobacillus sp. ISL-74]MBT2653601.1 phage gp6-like head-tail connector protein [Oceanobacillus sp. ISL-73]